MRKHIWAAVFFAMFGTAAYADGELSKECQEICKKDKVCEKNLKCTDKKNPMCAEALKAIHKLCDSKQAAAHPAKPAAAPAAAAKPAPAAAASKPAAPANKPANNTPPPAAPAPAPAAPVAGGCKPANTPSCKVPQNGQCFTSADGCSGQAVPQCPTDQLVGCCAVSSSDIRYYYANLDGYGGIPADQAKGVCAQLNGKWTAN